MKKILTTAALAAILPQSASALPLVDFYAGSYYWDQAVSGDVNNNVDLEDDLNLSASGQNVTYLAFEHPIPMIPNVKLKFSKLATDGNATTTSDLNLGFGTVSAGNISSDFDLSHNDYTFYWGLPLPLLTFDFGLTLRQFDGEMTSNNVSTDLDFVIPMGYLKAGIDIPLTGLSFAGDLNVISIGSTSMSDYDLNMTYVLPLIPLLDVGISAGYRSFDLDLDEDDFGDLSAEATIDGPYLGLSLHL